MKTIEAIAVVTPDGKIHIENPTGTLEVGEYKVVLVVEEQPASAPAPKKPLPPLNLKPLNWGYYPPDFTFRREDIYKDDEDWF
jgi:hypothetical protein